MTDRRAFLTGAVALTAATATPARASRTSPSVRLDGDRFSLTTDDGVRLRGWQAGLGRPILFVPGWSVTGNFFHQQFNRFSAANRVVTFDPRGQGTSAKTLAAHGIAQRAEDVARVIEHLDLHEVTLVGWSAGALDCVAYASKYGTSRIRSVMLVDQAPSGVARTPEDWGDFPLAVLPDLMRQFEADIAGFRNAVLREWLGPDHPDHSWCLAQMTQTPASIAVQTGFSVIAADHTADYVRLVNTRPAKLVVSTANQPACARFVAQHNLTCSMASFGGHAMMLTHASQFNDQIAELLS